METRLSGKRILITGATSGIGRVAAMNFAKHGAHVLVFCRSLEKGKELQDEHNRLLAAKKGTIELVECDLNSLDSIKKACLYIKSTHPSLDMLINNAGVWCFQQGFSSDGIEETFQVNVLAPLLIMNELLPLVLEVQGGKIINTASALHQGTIQFEDLEYKKSFNSFKIYRQSKLADILLTRLFAKRYENEAVKIICQHPGVIKTGLVRGGGWFAKLFFSLVGKSPEKGAENLIYLVHEDVEKLENGAYYKNKVATKTDTKASYDLVLAEKLEGVCLEYLGR
jgi:NAD(P)-dependent dehydrogenase (short-subunit alcohol dehydrogenase family)